MLSARDDSFECRTSNEQFHKHKEGRMEVHFRGLTLSSEFQSIYSLSHRKPIGYEGLLRIRDRKQTLIDPTTFFNKFTGEGEKVQIDRLSRTLHTQNFKIAGGNDAWLFLNIHPDVILNGPKYGAFFSACIEASGLSAENIVIEILENSISDRDLLSDALQYYRDIGCKIAIDDFGAMASNIDRLWSLEPDIVKLDRSLAIELEKPSVRRLLPSLVSMIHECGSLVLMEGIETEEQALAAIDTGVDFVQGYYLSRPCKDLWCESPTPCVGLGGANLSGMCDKYHQYVSEREQRHSDTLDKYVSPFERAAQMHAFSDSFAAFEDILSMSGVERCYILDKDGFQIGDTLFPENHETLFPSRFGHVGNAEGSSWFRRHYFRTAITSPETVKFSRPYLSLTSGIICKTLSLGLSTSEGDMRVYCCDIDWSDF
jgi:EAL domain-containing protein (putative c-di-GMP-specific phosphodiesterase class I)